MWFKIKAYIYLMMHQLQIAIMDDILFLCTPRLNQSISPIMKVSFLLNYVVLMMQQLQMVIIEDILSLCTPMLNQSISHIMKVSLLLYLYIETSNLHFQDQLKTRPLSSFSSFDNPRHLSSFSSFDNPRGRQIQKAPLRTRSMLAAFFVKHRSAKMKNVSVR